MTFRFRSSGALLDKVASAPWYSTDKVACQGDPIRGYRGDVNYYEWQGETRSMTDTVIKGFHKQVAEGKTFFNYLDSRRTVINPALITGSALIFKQNGFQCSGANQYQSIYEASGLTVLDHLRPYFTVYNGQWQAPSLLSQDMFEAAMVEANASCLNARGRPDFDIVEDLAEWRKTAQLAASYGHALESASKHLLNAVKHERSLVRRVEALGGVSSVAGSAYLMTRYGLAPAVQSCRNLLKAVETKEAEAVRKTTRGKSSVGQFTNATSTTAVHSHLTVTVNQLVTDQFDVRAMSLDEWPKANVFEHYGVSLKGLITLPWELVRLSFVADWFANIGDAIGASIPSPQLRQLGGCIVTTRTRSVTATVQRYNAVGIGEVLSNVSGIKTATLVEKVRFPGLRTPTVTVRPRFKNNPVLDKNWWRFADSCVLSGQILREVVYLLRT